MLIIGNRKFRNLPEQVGYNTAEIEKIWQKLDGLDVYDNVIVIDSLDPLTPDDLDIVSKPVAFIVYNNTLYMKRGVSGSNAYFDAVFQVSESLGVITFASAEITVSYPLGTLTLTTQNNSAYSKDETDTLLLAKLDETALLNKTYPVGSIYMSTDGTSPASLFGGTWLALEAKFLIGAGSGYTAGSTGGEASHTLTVSEMPSHSHTPAGHDNFMRFVGGSANLGYVSGNQIYAEPLNLSNTGGGDAHNNMPPYLVVYMWERTA